MNDLIFKNSYTDTKEKPSQRKRGQELVHRCVPELPKSCPRVAQSCPNLHHKELPGLFPTYYTILATFASLNKAGYMTRHKSRVVGQGQ